MEFDETATIRFVTDVDETNQFGFYREHLTHELMINGKKRIVPCLTMYGKKCPCCELSQKYYQAEGKETKLGKKYWRKKAYLTQAVVISSPFDYDMKGNNVKILELGPKIFDIIKDAIIKGDIDVDPDTLKGGYDFRLTKKKQGDYADYSLSRFAPRPTDVSDSLLTEFNPFNLSEFLTKEITAEKMEQLIHADQTGEDVPSDSDQKAPDNDPKPTHEDRQEAAKDIINAAKQSEPQASEDKQENSASAPAKSAADILQQIKDRAKANQAQ